jgi:hypothetical protein
MRRRFECDKQNIKDQELDRVSIVKRGICASDKEGRRTSRNQGWAVSDKPAGKDWICNDTAHGGGNDDAIIPARAPRVGGARKKQFSMRNRGEVRSIVMGLPELLSTWPV